jgi:Fe-S-cluster containining protein
MNVPARLHPYKVIAFREYEILVPFVCHRCGNCCRNYDPVIEMELLPEIARTLGEPINVIQERLRVQNHSHRTGRPTDCCFLHPGNSECIIHEVRPTDCRQFPPLAGVGAGSIDCPGYREYRSALNSFAGRSECVRQFRSAATRGRRQIPAHDRNDILRALTAAMVSDQYRQVFEEING